MLLSRRIRESEWMKATAALEELGMTEGWVQEFDGARTTTARISTTLTAI